MLKFNRKHVPSDYVMRARVKQVGETQMWGRDVTGTRKIFQKDEKQLINF